MTTQAKVRRHQSRLRTGESTFQHSQGDTGGVKGGGVNQFTETVNMVDQWRKPNAEEAAKGFIAMLPRVYYCQLEGRGLQRIDYSGGYVDKDKKTVYPRRTEWEGFSQARLERRAMYGTGSLPSWWEPRVEGYELPQGEMQAA